MDGGKPQRTPILVDDSLAKRVPNPLRTIIFLDTWTNNRKVTFLANELAPHIRRLMRHLGSVSIFFSSTQLAMDH